MCNEEPNNSAATPLLLTKARGHRGTLLYKGLWKQLELHATKYTHIYLVD